MFRKTLVIAATAVAFALAVVPASQAADIGGQCFSGQYSSHLVNMPRPDLDAEIEKRYETAVMTSEERSVIYRNHPLWTWANETKVSCGKAIGFLKSDEINDEQITQCDCFYGIMFYLAN
jgi:hypothetical protein